MIKKLIPNYTVGKKMAHFLKAKLVEKIRARSRIAPVMGKSAVSAAVENGPKIKEIRVANAPLIMDIFQSL
jgi:hypothetical protein